MLWLYWVVATVMSFACINNNYNGLPPQQPPFVSSDSSGCGGCSDVGCRSSFGSTATSFLPQPHDFNRRDLFSNEEDELRAQLLPLIQHVEAGGVEDADDIVTLVLNMVQNKRSIEYIQSEVSLPSLIIIATLS